MPEGENFISKIINRIKKPNQSGSQDGRNNTPIDEKVSLTIEDKINARVLPHAEDAWVLGNANNPRRDLDEDEPLK